MASAMVCESCRGGHYEDKIILCDRCDRGWHLFCLTPPLRKVPKGNWVCPVCDAARRGDHPGAFGEEITLADFESKARDFESQWYQDVDEDSVDHVEREREFWNIVAGGEDLAEVLYASDPRVQLKRTEAQKRKGFAQIPAWKNEFSQNLASFCEGNKQGSSKIPGLHSGRVEFGMTFSSTPWKVQEQLLYLSTYHHSGAVKQWYCIPSYASSMFDSLIQQLHSDYMLSMEWESPLGPNLMVSPETLISRGVPVYGCTQEKGTLVVCFPNSYSCSLNLGLNISESILMVLPEWLRISSQAASLYRNHRVPPLFSVENMILNVLKDVQLVGAETKYWLSLEFSRIVEEESMLRHKLWGEGLRQYRKITQTNEEEESQKKESLTPRVDHCVICRTLLPFSMVECPCSPKKAACLYHRQHLCKCKIGRHRLAWRYSITELEEMCSKFSEGFSKEDIEYIESFEQNLEVSVTQAIGEAITQARASEEEMREVIMMKHLQDQTSKKKNSKSKKGKKEMKTCKIEAHDEAAMADYCALEPGAPLTFVTECGYVQGPIRQFSHLDLHPEDFQSLHTWKQEIERNCKKWMVDAQLALDEGGERAFELPDLIEESEEYLWGSIHPNVKAKIAELCPKLQKADDFVESIFVALNNKPPLEDIVKILSTDPLPLNSPPKLDELRLTVNNANDWIEKHAAVVSDLTIDPPFDSKHLDAIVAEAGKIPATIPEAKALKERLASVKKVAEAVRTALPKNRDTGRRKNSDDPITLEFIEKLQQDAKDAHIMMPEIITLNDALERVHAWREKVEMAMANRSPWSVYEALIEEGKTMPCEMPDIERLYELQDSVAMWIAEMREIKGAGAPLKKMRELLDRGYKLPLSFPEVGEMAEYIKKFEWEESAIRCIEFPETLDNIRYTISSKPQDDEKLASGIIPLLEKKISDAEAWISLASQFSELHSESLPKLEEVEHLVNEGQKTGVKLELLDEYNERLAKAQRWVHRCTKCLSGVSESPLKPPEMHSKRSPIVDSSHPLVRKRLFWSDNKVRDKFPSYTVVNALVSEYDELGIDLPYFKILCELQKRAVDWLEEAESILNQTDLKEEQIPHVESLIEKGLKTGVKIAQVDNLESYLHSFIWKQTTEDILTSQNSSNSDSKLGLDLLISLLDEGDVFASNTPAYKELKKLVNVGTRWQKEANAILRTEKPKIVSMNHLKEFLKTGRSSAIEVGSQLDEIESLITEHDDLVGTISGLLELDAGLEANNASGTLSEVPEYFKRLVKLPVESDGKTIVLKAMKKVEKLRSSTQSDVGTLFATYPLEQALVYIHTMLDSAHNQLNKLFANDSFNLENYKIDNVQAEDEGMLFCICQQTSGADSAMVECDRCSEWYHTTCVGYRSKMKGRRSKKSEACQNMNTTFVCPICTTLSATDLSVEKAVQQLRPPNFTCTTEDDLLSLDKTLKQAKLLSDLEDRVTHILEANTSWREKVARVLQNTVDVCTKNADERSVKVLDSVLRQLLKSSLSTYMDYTILCHIIFKHLKINKWRGDALRLEDQVTNPEVELSGSLLDDIQSVLNQGKILCVSETDGIYSRIVAAYDSVIKWKNEAENALSRLRVINDPNSKSWFLASMDVQNSIKSGQKLKWSVSQDIQVLKDNSSLYCLCRRLSDEECAMIQCDICEEWFHFGCVGRHEPISAGVDDDSSSWSCPICSFAANTPYEFEKSMPKESENTLTAIKECLPHLSQVFGHDVYKKILPLFNSAPFQHLYNNRIVPDVSMIPSEHKELLEQLQQVKMPYSFYSRMNHGSRSPGDRDDLSPMDVSHRHGHKILEEKHIITEKIAEVKDEDQILHIDDDEIGPWDPSVGV